MNNIRAHLFRMFHSCLSENVEQRLALTACKTVEHFYAVVDVIEAKYKDEVFDYENIQVGEDGIRKYPNWMLQPKIRGPNLNPGKKITAVMSEIKKIEPMAPIQVIVKEEVILDAPLPSKKRKQSSTDQPQKPHNKKRIRLDLCGNTANCTNIGSKLCGSQLCKTCCRKSESGCAYHKKKKGEVGKKGWCCIL
jgi:hypothetical protein